MTFTTWGELHPAQTRFRKCKCNMCGHTFGEDEILVDDDTEKEYCPRCFDKGYIQDIEGDDMEGSE